MECIVEGIGPQHHRASSPVSSRPAAEPLLEGLRRKQECAEGEWNRIEREQRSYTLRGTPPNLGHEVEPMPALTPGRGSDRPAGGATKTGGRVGSLVILA